MHRGNTTLGDAEKTGIDEFKGKAREFWGMWNKLEDKSDMVAASSPKLQREYNDLMERGVTIRTNIERITRVIDSAVGAYGKAVDYTSRGMETAINWFKGTTGLGELNIIPLIPIAVMGVALAMMGKWMKDAYVVNKKINMVNKLINKGMSPEKALNITSKLISKPSFFNVSAGVGLPLIAAAVIGFLYFRKGKK